MHVGLIGAGMMGHGMAVNLLKHGHRVSVIAHRNRSPIDDLVARGALEARSLAEIAGAEAIILCLTTSEVVAETLQGLAPHLRPAQIVLDAGTSDPGVTARLAREMGSRGIAYADIPLTGGPEQAEQGVLGVLCGADPETFTRIAPLLACFATTVRHFGPPGTGHAAKLISNYLVTGMVALVAEAFGAARLAGIDWKNLYEVMLNGSGNSGVLRKMVAPALEGDFDGYRFALANAAKDIGYYAGLAAGLGCRTPLTEAVAETFSKAVQTGHGGRNVSRLLDPATDDVSRC
jgi:3-hydroxyisobutyrate dehydrogenase-like beta-hydroxyacid dehydrogenase